MGSPEAIGSDVPNLMKDIPNFVKGCTKGSKVRSEVGIGLESFPYEFLDEIMDHPCSNGGPGSNRIGCTEFNEGCTKFCE